MKYFSKVFFFFSVVMTFSNCHVMFIGAYDPVVDQEIQKIQKDVSILLIQLQHDNIDKDNASSNYSNYKIQYITIEAETEDLTIRCKALPKYAKVSEQVQLLNDNLHNLEKLHKIGLSDIATVNILQSTFETEFVAIIKLQNGLKREKAN